MRKRVVGVALGICLILSAQNGQVQKPGEIQKPRGTWQVPGPIQKPGEIQKVKEQCKSRLLVGSDALFEFDRAELTSGAEKVLSALRPMIQQEGNHPLTIEGHTDSIGAADYNQKLSEMRAKAVETWLLAHEFAHAGATQIVGYGSKKPLVPNTKPDGSDDPKGREKNRRVEVVIDTCKT